MREQDGEVLSLLYESLLLPAARKSRLPEFEDEALAGGRRIGSNDVGIIGVGGVK